MGKETFWANPIKVRRLVFLFSFAVFACLFYLVPLVSDDIFFSTLPIHDIGDALRYSLHYGNGRLLGNTFALLLSHSTALRVLVKALCASCVVVLLPTVLRTESPLMYSFSFLFILCAKFTMFDQTFLWTSGFTNYVMPATILLFCLVLLEAYGRTAGKLRGIYLALLGVLSFSAQLFTEHSSIVHFVLAAILLAAAIKKRSGGLAASGVFFAGTLLGGLAMIAIPYLFAGGGDALSGYRHIQTLPEIPYSMLAHGIGFSYNVMNYLPVIILLYAVPIMVMPKGVPEKYRRIDRISDLCLALYAAFAVFQWVNPQVAWHDASTLLMNLLALCLSCLVLIAIYWKACFIPAEKTKRNVQICLILMFFSLAPLLIVSIFAERCAFYAFFFLAGAAIALMDEAFKKRSASATGRAGAALCAAAILLSGIQLLHGMDQRRYDIERTAYIEAEVAKGATTIEVFEFPNSYEEVTNCWALCERYYYEEAGDITFLALPYDEWRMKHGA